MSKKFEKWFNEFYGDSDESGCAEEDTKNGWNAARDKIVEILRMETRKYEGADEVNSFEFVPERIINEIENL